MDDLFVSKVALSVAVAAATLWLCIKLWNLEMSRRARTALVVVGSLVGASIIEIIVEVMVLY